MAQRLGIRRPRVAGRMPAGQLVKVANGYTAGPTTLPGGATIPPGSQVTDATHMLGALQARTAMGINGAVPLPRDKQFWALMGPGAPLYPSPFNVPNPATGQADARRFEYPISWNITGLETGRRVAWSTLRAASRDVDLIAECLRVRRTEQSELEWDITLTRRTMQANGIASSDDKTRLLKKYAPDIARLIDFWSEPDSRNGYNWTEWVEQVIHEMMVTDAVSIFPQCTYGGKLLSLTNVDGATIKPLLDEYGNRPMAPAPAYQQWLYGFPRGEYTDTGAGEPDWSGAAGSLIYKPRFTQVDSPYGYSPVEQCLVSADLWLRRQQWMIAEYTAGTAPRMILKAAGVQYTPEQIRAYEDLLNDFYGGSTDARHRLRLFPEGIDPTLVDDAAERYKPDYDEFLVKLVCLHMGVQPQEIGFTPRNGLGGAGHGESQEAITYRKALRPTAKWLVELMNQISYAYLDMPRDLTFQFLGLDEEGEAEADALEEKRFRSGRGTLNEARDAIGKSRYAFAEADMPMIVTERGVVFLEGASALVEPGELVAPVQAPPMTAPPEGPNSQANPQVPVVAAREAKQPAQQAAAPSKDGKKRQSAKPAPDDEDTGADTSKADSRSTAEQVVEQLSQDYPADATDWVSRFDWHLRSVPLDQIDFSNVDSWRAAKEPEKVAKFARKIAKGKLTPAVLVRTPGSAKYIVIDGHHRSLAARQLGRSVTAWVAKVDAKTGPWDEMHGQQVHGPSGPTANTEPVGKVDAPADEEAKRAEIAAFYRWAKKGTRSRPFQFTAVTKTDAMLHEIPLDRVVFKAGGGSGKATPRHWPGWEQDQAVAKHWAPRVAAAISGAVDPRELAEEWLSLRKAVLADALHWLTDKLGSIAGRLRDAFRGIYTEGWLVGRRSADAVVSGTRADWSSWTPGDLKAAEALIGEDVNLASLLSGMDVTIKSIADNRLGVLAQALADGLANGDSVDTLSRSLRDVLDDPAWADLVATTETTRAMSYATQQTYLANGITDNFWLTAEDQRVCPACDQNEAYGANPIGQDFPSGQSMPPGHPACRCCLYAQTE